MKERISINEFAFYVSYAKKKYPSARVCGLGERFTNGKWVFVIYLDVDGKEVLYPIPEREV